MRPQRAVHAAIMAMVHDGHGDKRRTVLRPGGPVRLSLAASCFAGVLAAQIATVQKVPLDDGPVFAITTAGAASTPSDYQRILVATTAAAGPAQELLRTEPGHTLRLLARLDRQRLLCSDGLPFLRHDLVLVDAASGTWRLLATNCVGEHPVRGDHVVLLDPETIGQVDWRGGGPAVRWPHDLHTDLQCVGEAVFGIGDAGLCRVGLEDGVRKSFGPRDAASATSLEVAPDGAHYALGRWSETPRPPPLWRKSPAHPFPTMDSIKFGTITIHDMATDLVVRRIDDVAVFKSTFNSNVVVPSCRWLDADHLIVDRLRHEAELDRIAEVAVAVASGAERDLTEAEGARKEPTSWFVHATAWPGPRHASPDGAWTAILATPNADTTTVVIEHNPSGRRRALGTFVVVDCQWLPGL